MQAGELQGRQVLRVAQGQRVIQALRAIQVQQGRKEILVRLVPPVYKAIPAQREVQGQQGRKASQDLLALMERRERKVPLGLRELAAQTAIRDQPGLQAWVEEQRGLRGHQV